MRSQSRRRRERPRLRWVDCVKRGLAGVEGEGRMRTRDGGMETIGRDGSETGQLMKKKGKQKHRRPVSVPASPGTTGI